MNNNIHPTAIISPEAIIGHNNVIGPFCVIGPEVVIGDHNVFTSHITVGTPPQHKSYSQTKSSSVHIGNFNVFREFVSIHGGTVSTTKIHNHCFIMTGTSVAHDMVIEDKVTIANAANMAGHVYIMEGATISLGAVAHQRQVIGAYSILGMGAIVTKACNILPGHKYIGAPAVSIGLNEIGLSRNSIGSEQLQALENRFWELKQSIC